MKEIKPGTNTPNPVLSCAGALASALRKFDAQKIGEAHSETIKRMDLAEHLGLKCLALSDELSSGFCREHCAPDYCPSHTGETVIRINQQVLREGGTDNKQQVLEKLDKAGSLLQESTSPKCPFTVNPDPYTHIADEISRGLSPHELAEIGLGSETSPLGGTVAEDIDAETILDMVS